MLSQNKSKCATATILCVLQKPITFTEVHLICFLQFMTKKKNTKKGTAVHLICSKKYLRRCSTIICTIVQIICTAVHYSASAVPILKV